MAGDSELVLDTSLAYDHYEVINNIEIGRDISLMANGSEPGWTYTWTYDVTDYAFLLHDSVQIRSLYEGYSQGSLYTLSFDMIEGTPPGRCIQSESTRVWRFSVWQRQQPDQQLLPALAHCAGFHRRCYHASPYHHRSRRG